MEVRFAADWSNTWMTTLAGVVFLNWKETWSYPAKSPVGMNLVKRSVPFETDPVMDMAPPGPSALWLASQPEVAWLAQPSSPAEKQVMIGSLAGSGASGDQHQATGVATPQVGEGVGEPVKVGVGVSETGQKLA